MNDTIDNERPQRRAMTPNRLREIIRAALVERPDITEVRDTSTVHMDRLALKVTDSAALVWRVWISRDPRPENGR